MVDLLQKRTEDGFAFRVDLRLRPSPEITPLALPVDAAISYYEASALPWERAAFIRARFAGGDEAVGRYFLDALHPFVWRRSLDFGAVGEIQSLTRRIRDHYAQGQKFGAGFDLKRGRGGIREIEFFVQIHQLIHGGRDPALRSPSTLDALGALTTAGRLEPQEDKELREPIGCCGPSSTGCKWSRIGRPTPSTRGGARKCRASSRPFRGRSLIRSARATAASRGGIYAGLGAGDDRRLPVDADGWQKA